MYDDVALQVSALAHLQTSTNMYSIKTLMRKKKTETKKKRQTINNKNDQLLG